MKDAERQEKDPVKRLERNLRAIQPRIASLLRSMLPKTFPCYLPVFDFSQRLTPEQVADVERQKKLLREYRRKKKSLVHK